MHGLYLEPEVRAAVVERFGPGVLGDDGEVDRAALARARVRRRGVRRWLEQLLHPRVAAALERWRSEQEAARPGRAARARGAAAVRGRARRSLRRRRADHRTRRRAPRAPARALRRARRRAAARGGEGRCAPITCTSTTARPPSSSAGSPTSSPACARHEAARPASPAALVIVAGGAATGSSASKGRELLERTRVPAALPGDRARPRAHVRPRSRRCWPRSSTASRASARTCAARRARSG